MTPQKRPSRARLLIAASVVTLAATCVTAPTAPAATTPSGLNQTVTVYHSSGDAAASTQVGISTSLFKTGGGTLSPTTEIAVQFPNGLVRNAASFPTCTAATLTQQGPNACPTANVGYGSLTLYAGTTEIYAQVYAFNGPNGTLLLYVAPQLGSPFVITGTPSGATLTIPIPPIKTVQGAPDAAIAQMDLGLGNGNYLVNPGTACPYQYSFSFKYANNETLLVPATAGCPPVAAFTLSPKTATLTVGAQACVTANFSYGGTPYEDMQVRFSVSGANAGATGVPRTDTSGNARFCYTGGKLGSDTITAFADYTEDGTRDEGEPGDTATITFTAPAAVKSTAPTKAKKKSCRVPKVRGLSLKKAKKKLGKAGCRYKTRGKGRVVSTSPSAGKQTAKTVLIKAKKGKGKRK